MQGAAHLPRWWCAAGIPVLLAVACWALAGTRSAPPAVADAREVTRGRLLYKQHCASCHGRNLQGQPLWQMRDAFTHRRAPALDQTGRAWLLADAALLQITREGGSAEPSAASGMPAFAAVLDERDTLAVVAFVKARWPLGLRVLQAARNPDHRGLPPEAARADWTVPADCMPGQSAPE